ncbi:MAG: metallophosphoesterase [Polyangiales bacterium]
MGARFTIAFASDLHLGPTTPRATLDAAFAALAGANADVIAFGGDFLFLDATPSRMRELSARVSELPARIKVAVLGNHDLWAEHRRIEEALERGGAKVLINDAIVVGDVAIAGIDDPWTGAPDAARALAHCRGASRVIGLTHAPDGAPMLAAAARRIGLPLDLVLAGHTHGGHVALPSGPIWAPGPLGMRFSSGLHSAFGTRLFVSRGVGGIELPIRTWAPPDVAVISLACAP